MENINEHPDPTTPPPNTGRSPARARRPLRRRATDRAAAGAGPDGAAAANRTAANRAADDRAADDRAADDRTAAARRTDDLLAEVATLGDRAEELGRLMSPMHLARAEQLHRARMLALAAPDLFARGKTLSRNETRDLVERSIRAELAVALHQSEAATARDLDHAQLLTDHLPATRAALADARMTWAVGQLICTTAGTLPAETRPMFDDRATDLATDPDTRYTPPQLRRALERLREDLHPEPLPERHKEAVKDRSVWVKAERDGMCTISALLPAPSAMGAYDRIDRIARGLRTLDGEDRTLAQLRADALTDILTDGDITGTTPDHTWTTGATGTTGASTTGASTTGVTNTTRATGTAGASGTAGSIGAPGATGEIGTTSATAAGTAATDATGSGRPAPTFLPGVRAEVRITVPVLTAAGLENESAELDGYGPIPADIARELVGTGTAFYRVLTDPITGQARSVGRVRNPPTEMRRFLDARDQVCRFAGCTRRAKTAELDHTLEWAKGGHTETRNLVHLCTAHHHVRHGDRWTYRLNADASVEWTTPTGRKVTTRPPLLPGAKAGPRFTDLRPTTVRDSGEPNDAWAVEPGLTEESPASLPF